MYEEGVTVSPDLDLSLGAMSAPILDMHIHETRHVSVRMYRATHHRCCLQGNRLDVPSPPGPKVPSIRPHGAPFADNSWRHGLGQQGAPLRTGGACLAKCGDWAWFKSAMGLRGWRGRRQLGNAAGYARPALTRPTSPTISQQKPLGAPPS